MDEAYDHYRETIIRIGYASIHTKLMNSMDQHELPHAILPYFEMQMRKAILCMYIHVLIWGLVTAPAVS
jgi:hypothetical protein